MAPCTLDVVATPEPIAELERHEAEGLRLHAHTAMSGWLGERLDVGYAIDVLHPLAVEPGQRAGQALGREPDLDPESRDLGNRLLPVAEA